MSVPVYAMNAKAQRGLPASCRQIRRCELQTMKLRRGSAGFDGSRSATINGGRIEELAAEARYHRERLQLYRARFHSSRPATAMRLQELERISEHADRRLRRAEGDAPR